MNFETTHSNLVGVGAGVVLAILIMATILACAVGPAMFGSFLGPILGIAPETATPTPTRTPKPMFTATATHTATPDVTIDFRADRESIVAGESLVLQWNVVNAETVIINDIIVGPSGAEQLNPSETSTWVLRAEGPSGSVERQVTVVVTQSTATATPAVTDTPTSTHTPTRRPATPTATRRPPTATPRGPTATPVPSYQYSLGYIEYLPNCLLTRIEGTVWNPDGATQRAGARVKVWTGGWESPIRVTPTDDGKGSGYYDVILGAEGPRAGHWFVVIVDGNGNPLSETIPFETNTADCTPDGNGRQTVIADFVANF